MGAYGQCSAFHVTWWDVHEALGNACSTAQGINQCVEARVKRQQRTVLSTTLLIDNSKFTLYRHP